MSMISEQIKMLEAVKDEIGRHHDEGWAWTAQAIDEAISTIQDLSAKLAAANMERSSKYYDGGWISVEDRLPELPKCKWASKMVIACTEARYVTPMVYEKAVVRKKEVTRWKYYWDRIADEEVAYWMPLPPLPEPYKGGKENVDD